MELSLPTRVRLGGFQLDLQTGELQAMLLADGSAPVYLRAQPFQVLKMLVERNGKIVTREEIRKKLWPNDTIVDFDHSINVAIGVLRRAFGDSAGQPKYIKTLAKRGYRLLVAVEALKTNPGIVSVAVGSSRVTNGPSSMTGKRASHYRVLEVIGGGGMGMVYEAEDLKLGRRVALKFLPDDLATDPIALKRFEREAQTASALNHPNICTIYEVEEFEGHPFIVMELLEGENLHRHLDACPSRILAVDRVVEIGIQICNGLQAAHEKSIIHRDIKPANIFLTQRGPVKILDFGLAKLAARNEEEAAEDQERLLSGSSNSRNGAAAHLFHADLTRTGAAGTVGYMSPEQVRKEPLNASSDLFSLGLVLYEAATGSRAFPGTTAAAVHAATLNETPAPAYDVNAAVPRRLWVVIAKALEKDPAQRYQSAAEMRIALEQTDENTRLRSLSSRRWLVAAALLVSIACGAWFYWRFRHSAPALTSSDTVVLAVNNRTADPVFNDAIFTAAYYGLQQTPFIHVLSTPKLLEAKQQLGMKAEINQSTDEGRKVCVQTKSRMVIAATVADEGNGFRIEAEGLDCRSGAVVAGASTKAVVRPDVIHQLGVALVALRGKLGEPAASLAKFNLPLDEATSASPEALQLLTDGYRRNLAYDLTGAATDYQRAIDLDGNFAMAYSAMGAAAGNLGHSEQQQTFLKRAYALRFRTTEAIRFQIDDNYYDEVTGEREKARSVLSQWVQAYPDDFIAHNNLARCLTILGQPDAALAEAREEVRLFPGQWSYGVVLGDSINANRIGEAHRALDEARKLNFDGDGLLFDRLLLAFVEKNSAAMEEQWKVGARDAKTAYVVEASKGLALGYSGHLQEYLRENMKIEQMAKKAGHSPGVSGPYVALDLANDGYFDEARRIAESYVASNPPKSSRLTLALALARAGDLLQAEKLASQADHDAPLDTIVQEVGLPSIRAAIKLQQDDAVGAIEALHPTLRYDLSNPDDFPSLYPAYLRGLAYLRLGNGKDAEAEFQKLYDHPGIVRNQQIGALAHLQMARAQQLAGDRTAARKSYEEFLSLWRTADSDVPIYRQAKAEYAKLALSSM